MTEEEIKQRIRYLVEHGGIYEDPTDEIRRMVNVNRLMAAAILLGVLVDVAIELLR